MESQMAVDCACLSVCVCLSVPSKPQDAAYISSTESSMTLSWIQSGAVDNYIIEYNNTATTSVNFTRVGDEGVSATVQDLPTSGTYYCVSVTAVSGHLRSHTAVLCNYTGEWLFCRHFHNECYYYYYTHFTTFFFMTL